MATNTLIQIQAPTSDDEIEETYLKSDVNDNTLKPDLTRYELHKETPDPGRQRSIRVKKKRKRHNQSRLNITTGKESGVNWGINEQIKQKTVTFAPVLNGVQLRNVPLNKSNGLSPIKERMELVTSVNETPVSQPDGEKRPHGSKQNGKANHINYNEMLLSDSSQSDFKTNKNEGEHEDNPTTDSKESDTSSRANSPSRWLTVKHMINATSRRQSVDVFIERFSTQPAPSQPQPTTNEESGIVFERRNKIRKWFQSCYLTKCTTPLQPDGLFLFCWLMLLSVIVEYDLWIQPMREGFPDIQEHYATVWSVLDRVADVIYFCDFAVQFRTGFLKHGILITSHREMALNYIKSKFFLIDLLTLIPTDLLFIAIGVYPLLRALKFLKIYRIVQCYRMGLMRSSAPNVLRVANLIHILILLCHFFAAINFRLTAIELTANNLSNNVTQDITTQYLKSLYWATLTLTTIGDFSTPQTNGLYFFQIVSYLIGIFVFAYIVGQVGNAINNNNSSRQQYERSLDGAKLFMKRHNVPKELQTKVQKWYDYSWTRGRLLGAGDMSSLSILPDRLRTLIAIHVNLHILRKVSIFEDCEPQFLQDIMLQMSSTMYNPGDLVVKKGEIAREMFIIADGKLDVLSEQGEIIASLESGNFFGEIGILNLDGVVNRRTADVRSVGFTELFVLEREVIVRAMRYYPNAKASLVKQAKVRLDILTRRQSSDNQDPNKKLEQEAISLPGTPMMGASLQPARTPSPRSNQTFSTIKSYSPRPNRMSTSVSSSSVQSLAERRGLKAHEHELITSLTEQLRRKNEIIQDLETRLYNAEDQLARFRK